MIYLENPTEYLLKGYEVANSNCIHKIVDGILYTKHGHRDWYKAPEAKQLNIHLSGDGWYLPHTDFTSEDILTAYLIGGGKVLTNTGVTVWFELVNYGYGLIPVQKHDHPTKTGKKYVLTPYWAFRKELPEHIRLLERYYEQKL